MDLETMLLTPVTPNMSLPSALSSEPVSIVQFDFRGSEIIAEVASRGRFTTFIRTFTFVHVIDVDLQEDLRALTLLDDSNLEYEPGSGTYRLADITRLFYRLCQHEYSFSVRNAEDLQELAQMLSQELDRLSSPAYQIDLSLARDEDGPTEWLEYFYWCHIVDHFQPFKAVVARVNHDGRISASGAPTAVRIMGARQVFNGIILCLTWRWGMDTILVEELAEMNKHGLYFSDQRMVTLPLLSGWATQVVSVANPLPVSELYWGVPRPDKERFGGYY